jgi:ElaB/YqjD/DUF883 family membrane-anchored ribosome-binding protein
MANDKEDLTRHEEEIRQQMEGTRSALKDKLETLELQVKETVQEATEAVETVKDTVKETVETVKETVEGTVETVKETVEQTVESVKETFNLNKQVRAHPWPAFACATVVGFVGGRLLGQAGKQNGQARATMETVPEAPPSLYRNSGATAPAKETVSAGRSFWNWVAEHYSDELNKLKGLGIAVVSGVVRDMVTAEVSPEIGDRLREVIDGFTEKLGATPIKEPIIQPSPRKSEASEKPPSHGFGPRWERSQTTPRY